MKIQGLKISMLDLQDLLIDLQEQSKELPMDEETADNHKWLIPIINKTPECSDTWEIENLEKDEMYRERPYCFSREREKINTYFREYYKKNINDKE